MGHRIFLLQTKSASLPALPLHTPAGQWNPHLHDGCDHWLNNVLSFPDGLSERITISSVSKGHIMSTSDPHGTDKSAEEPIPQTSLDVLLWKLDLLEAIINELPNPVFAKTAIPGSVFLIRHTNHFFPSGGKSC